jgi:hypothetical protein
MFKFLIKIGKEIFGTNSKRIADGLARQGGTRIPKSKLPKNATVKKAPTVAQPKSPSTGQFRRSQPPAARANTAPAAPRTAPKSPTAPKSGNKPRVPSRVTKPKPSTSVAQPRSPRSNSNSSGGPRPMKDITPNKNAPGRPSGSRIVGMNPKAMRAPNTKLGALDTAKPEVVVAPSDDKKPKTKKPPLKKTTKKQSDANKKAAETKKNAPTKTAPKKSPRPKQRPAAGPVTNESFGKAFARNRKSGNATFTWKDKKYTTRYKEESIAQHKKKFGVEGKY